MRTWKEQKKAERDLRRKWLQSLADSDLGLTELQRAVGCDRSTIYRMARQHGVLMQPQRSDNRGALSVARLEPCVKAGMTRAEISEYLGASVSAVGQAIKRHGFLQMEHDAAVARIEQWAAAKKPAPPKIHPLEQMKIDAAAANNRLRALNK